MGELSLSQDIYEGRPAVNLDMGSSLDMNSAEALAELLREAVSVGQPVIIDAASVERVSTSAIQLLLAADQALASAGCECALSNPSNFFLAAFADCGIQPGDMSWRIMAEHADG
jgi:anti-anti-sigma regulatory factor